MPMDMKEKIAQAALSILTQRRSKKLTVTDIVEKCHITRQAFYYHFADIPELLQWLLDKKTDEVLKEALSKGNGEDGLRCFFTMAVSFVPYVKQGMGSAYRDEVERMVYQYTERYFSLVAEGKNFYLDCTRLETKIIIRYHSQAIFGLLKDWTEDDTRHLNQIVHTVYRLMMEGIPPVGKAK